MNVRKRHLLKIIAEYPNLNQRQLAEQCGYSLGLVNKLVSQLIREGYITEDFALLPLAYEEFRSSSPKNAIILAAGFGMRMIPLNMEFPKGLIEINGEPLIERILRQLHEVGITDISVVVGFMKEKYEYLIDEYGVDLIVNSQYAVRNNLYSLWMAEDKIFNTYIIPCDIWCANNPFSRRELFSWYMVNDLVDDKSMVRINRKMELVRVDMGASGNGMLGISYLMGEEATTVRKKLCQYSELLQYNDCFWEETLFDRDKMIVYANVVHFMNALEIDTYEKLREVEGDSSQLNNSAIHVICKIFNVDESAVTHIEMLKKGMTNRSFIFQCKGKKYIMRVPGEGKRQLINRRQETDVYRVIKDEHICDDVIYINSENGYKITRFLEDARVCDPYNQDDVKRCMKKLRSFHDAGYQVEHEFDLFGQIDFYESLWKGSKSIYKDYAATKKHVWELKEFIEEHSGKKVLTHIDAVPDNFLFWNSPKGSEDIRLIDWEYAGMQDPHVDVAMFAVYSLYSRQQVDCLIDLYFEQQCRMEDRIKLYCYIAVCGLLWSNWCEYKRQLGVEFGEYALRQYRYAKDYYRIAKEEFDLLEKSRG